MLSEVCQELRNWFDRDQPKLLNRSIEISGGRILDQDFTNMIKPNQYFRIIGSTFNDGVYQYVENMDLTDEKFIGSLWLMAVPKEVITLSSDIDQWLTDYSEVINSPYASESFGGYSYTKANGGSNNGSSNPSWQSVFASKLNLWRKI